MGNRQRKVERRRVKRQVHRREKQIFARRQVERLKSDKTELHACVVNQDWRELGKASIFVARTIGPRRAVMAAFLVDLWAMGLKDAWGVTDLSYSEFNDYVSKLDAQLGACSLKLDTAKHLVYGGINLAKELGFRLPRKYERWTAVLGPLPEGESPDMSLFRCNGKIRLECSRRDLEARLIGSTPEAFLARPDMEFMFGDDDFTLVDGDADGFEDCIEQFEKAMLDRARQWCFANGQTPHPLLADVVGATIEAILQSCPPDVDPDDDEIPALTDEEQDDITQRVASILGDVGEDDPDGLDVAMDQFGGFMQSAGSPGELFAALGLDE